VTATLPDGFDPTTVCLTVDVEWAAPEVLQDLVGLLDERELKGTFFVTHEGVSVPGHERAIHPNFRADGDVRRAQVASNAERQVTDAEMYEHVVSTFKNFAPESVGVRGHSLHYDSLLLPIYHRLGIQYDSTYQVPLARDLAPFWKEYDILEMPIYFNDFYELKAAPLGFDARNIDLAAPGLKVIDIHPNTMFVNAHSLEHYEATRGAYRDPDRLMEFRHDGPGVRTLMIDVFDRLAEERRPTATMGEVNSLWRGLSA
jgi:hypothetical protein